MALECRIPISPTRPFLQRTRLLAASIREFYPDAIVRAYVGEPGGCTERTIQMVSEALHRDRINIEWVGAAEFDEWAGTRSPFLATMNRRFRGPVDGDHVLLLDADVICTGRFDELFAVDAVQGVQAHVAPFDDIVWARLFRSAALPLPRYGFAYSGGGIMEHAQRLGPWYVNSGMVFAPRRLFEKLCRPYAASVSLLRSSLSDTYWADQLALAMAVVWAEVPMRSLPLRYNFPNQAAFDAMHPAELADVRFVHFLRLDTVDRDRDFDDVPAMARLVGRDDLRGSNEVLRRRVGQLLERVMPPPLTCAEDAPHA